MENPKFLKEKYNLHTAPEVEKAAKRTEKSPNLRLQYSEQPLNEWFLIAMKQISDRDGDLGVFDLVRDSGGLWLSGGWARPGSRWNPDFEFVFSRSRK